MSLLKKMFGGGAGQKKGLSAREGYELALQTLSEAHPEAANTAYLCCLYTSLYDSDAELQEDGTCRGWHFDFFMPSSSTLYLTRVKNGKTRTRELPWDKTQKRRIEYVFATYGMQSDGGIVSEPERVQEDWLDSPTIAATALEAAKPLYNPEQIDDPIIVALCLSAKCLRYLQEEKAMQQLGFPAAPENCFAAICSTDELYQEDSQLLYIEAGTGKIVQQYPFRYPDLFYFGDSRDW